MRLPRDIEDLISHALLEPSHDKARKKPSFTLVAPELLGNTQNNNLWPLPLVVAVIVHHPHRDAFSQGFSGYGHDEGDCVIIDIDGEPYPRGRSIQIWCI